MPGLNTAGFQDYPRSIGITQRYVAPYLSHQNPTARMKRVVKMIIVKFFQKDHRVVPRYQIIQSSPKCTSPCGDSTMWILSYNFQLHCNMMRMIAMSCLKLTYHRVGSSIIYIVSGESLFLANLLYIQFTFMNIYNF